MSLQDKRPSRRSDDPDSTAELPALADPGLADPDSWVAPPPVRGTLIDEVLQAHETEIQLLRRELAHAARERAAYESQYHEAIADREEMRQHLDAAEARADDMARQLNDIERSVEERDVRIGELQLDLDDAAGAPDAAVAAAASAAAAAAVDAANGRAAREEDAELRALRAEIEQLRWRAAAQSEALQSREVRRQVHESQWRELEAVIHERDERIRLLEQEVTAARATARRLAATTTATAMATATAAGAPGAPPPGEATPTAPGSAPVAVAAAAAAAEEPVAGEPTGAEHAAAAPAAAEHDPAEPADSAAPAAAAPAAEPAAPAVPLEAEPWPPTAHEAAGGDAPADAPAAGPAPAGDASPAAPPRRKAGAGAQAARARVADNSAFSATGDFAATGDFSAGQHAGQRATQSLVPMLVCTDAGHGVVHVLGRRTTVGRTPDNDLRINAEWISRHHAVVLQTKSGTVLEDLNSTNGVLVNGLRVARRQLEAGDMITFGKSNFRYELKSAGGEPA